MISMLPDMEPNQFRSPCLEPLVLRPLSLCRVGLPEVRPLIIDLFEQRQTLRLELGNCCKSSRGVINTEISDGRHSWVPSAFEFLEHLIPHPAS